eukprot:jgi/Orpsp1_1/1190863/evm.model.d7180000081719.1
MEIHSNGSLKKDKNYFEIYLVNSDLKDNERICAKIITCFCNYKDYSKLKTYYQPIYCFSSTNTNGYDGYQKRIYTNDYNKYIKPLIEDGKIVIGFYIRVYDNNKYISLMSKSIEHKDDNNFELKGQNYYEWAIDYWSRLEKSWNISPIFKVGNYHWQIGIMPYNYNNQCDYISFLLYNTNHYTLKENESLYVNWTFLIRRSNDLSCYKAKC